MRILTFTELFPNSVDLNYGIFIYQRSAHLAKHPGVEVIVVAPVPYIPRWWKTARWRKSSDLPSEERIGGLEVHHPRYFLLPRIWMPFHALTMFLGCWRRVAELNKRANIDCIDAHFVYPDGLAAILLGKALRVPVCVSARGTDINVYPTFRLIRPMIRWTLSRAGALIAVSAALKEEMVALGAKTEKVFLIPNGVDPERFTPVSREQARTKLGLPLESPIVVSVGALIPSKGHLRLIRAFAQIAPRHPGLQLYILGEGRLHSDLEALVSELGLQHSVHLMGRQSNAVLPQWFCAAEASCLISEREGWPNVVTESLACGTPVVATRVGGIPEILKSPEMGILVENSVESVAGGIELALSRKWDRPQIARQTRARTWDTVATEVEAVLEAQIQARKQPGS
ncbi:MAG TPA: glycosyltransferase family 4 protein [Candidatus Acidoferrum sp.]|nr:glycosyltransferase family 4 protein [Candidatus Acidoferrum sp.]